MAVSEPLVSVIIPCHNAEKFAEISITSIINQSYQNLEIILIDDCSSDSTLRVLNCLAQSDARVYVVKNQSNLKIAGTLNKGLQLATGKYIARMDADDISYQERIKKQVDFLERNADVGMCGSAITLIDDLGNINGKIEYPSDTETIKAELLFGCPFIHPSVMIRKSVFESLEPYMENIIVGQDYELWLRIANKFKVSNIAEPLLYYRWHGNNISSNNSQKVYADMRFAIEHNLSSIPFSKSYETYHLKFLCGFWVQQTTASEVLGFKNWKKELLDLNQRLNYVSDVALKRVFNKHFAHIMLLVLKNNANGFQVKLAALKNLLTVNPLQTVDLFIRKVKMKRALKFLSKFQ